MTLGISFSIQSDLGVSPVSSLPLALTLTTGLTIGVTTVIGNVIFIIVQIIVGRSIEIRRYIVQLLIVFLFGFFMDFTYFIIRLIPNNNTLILKVVYLVFSLYLIAFGLLCYITSGLPVMPYDSMTKVVSDRFNMQFGKVKVMNDIINVSVASLICLVGIHSLGAIGVGTVVAALFIGMILGWMIRTFQTSLNAWLNGTYTKKL